MGVGIKDEYAVKPDVECRVCKDKNKSPDRYSQKDELLEDYKSGWDDMCYTTAYMPYIGIAAVLLGWSMLDDL